MSRRSPKYALPKFPPAKFRVGDRVRVTGYAFQGGIFKIVEDRGNVGAEGRRLYAVTKTWADDDDRFTMPEDDLELASDLIDGAEPASAPINK